MPGSTRGAVSKARLSGRLALHPDGSIDAARSDQRRATTTDPSQQRGRQVPNVRPMPQAAVGAVAEMLREQGLPSPEGKIDFMAARTANEVLKARLRRMELQQKVGEQADQARAVALVFRLARQERDVWLGWPARVAALMAAELGVDEHLGSLAEVRCEFR